MAQFIDSVYITEYGNTKQLYPNHIFDWKMQGVNCATQDYAVGTTSEISFTFETDIKIRVNTNVYVSSPNPNNDQTIPYGPFVFSVVNVEKKKSVQSRYNVTCSCIRDLTNGFDDVIEKSDLELLPENYTLMELAEFAARGNVFFDYEELTNLSYVPSNTWWYQGLTYRQLYQWCCQLMSVNDAGTLWLKNPQSFAYTGQFAPTTYKNHCINFNTNNVKTVDIAGYKTPVIDKIWFGNESSDVGFSLGTGDQAMMFPATPLINSEDSSFLNPIYNKVHSLQQYTPLRIETFQEIPFVPEPKGEKSFVLNGDVYAIEDLETAGTTSHSDMDPRGLYRYVWCHIPPETNPYWGQDSTSFPLRDIDMFLPYHDYDDYRTQHPDTFAISHLKEYITQCEKGSVVILCNRYGLDKPAEDAFDYLEHGENCFMVLDYDDEEITISKCSGAFGDNTRYKTWQWDELVYYFNHTYFSSDYYYDRHSGYYNYIQNIYFPSACSQYLTNAVPNHSYPYYYNEEILDKPTDFYSFPGTFEVAVNKKFTMPAGATIYFITKEEGLQQAETISQVGWIDKMECPYLIPENTSWKIGLFTLTGSVSDSLYQWLFYKTQEDPEPEPEPEQETISFTIPMLAWNYINNNTYFTTGCEKNTWMSFTDDKYNSYFCPIFNWEASPQGIVLEGTGNSDRRTENSYLSYELRTAGKYEEINSSISSAEGEASQAAANISALNIRMGNAEASLNNKVETSDYNGNEIVSKINSGATTTINTNRLNLAGYAQTGNLAPVATSGNYNDLINKPTIPAAQIQSDWTQTSSSAKDYIKHKPTNVSNFNNDAGYITATDLGSTGTVTIDSGRMITVYENDDTYETTAADTYEYSSVSFNIPANKVFTVEVQGYTSDTETPTGVVLSDSNSSISVLKEVVTADMPSADRLSMTYVGHPTTGITYSIWVKTASAATVGISYTGWYM